MRESAAVALTADQAAAADRGLKFLVPFHGRPFLDWVLDDVAAAGFEEACVVVSPGSPLGERDWGPAPLRVATTVQEAPRGGADAVLASAPVVGDRDLVVINADNLYPARVLARLLELDGPGLVGFERETLVRESNIPEERVAAFALIDEEGGVLKEIVEKPSPEQAAARPEALVSMTCWRFDASIFDACRDVAPSPRGELELPDAVALSMRRGVRYRVIRAATGVLDVSRREDIPRVERFLAPRARGCTDARVPARIFVPGRIELLGKHTDYAGGSSLMVAVDRGFTFEADAGAGGEVVVASAATGQQARWVIREGADRRTAGRAVGSRRRLVLDGPGPGAPAWARYADAMLRALATDFEDAPGATRITFDSTLPAAAGLSSSSALLTGVFLALDAVHGLSARPDFRAALPDRAALAAWLASAEAGEAVGTRGGSEDHAALLLAEPGRVVRYGFAPIRARGSAPLPPGWRFAVGVSGVVAEKGGAVRERFNRLSELAAMAARAWAAGVGDAADPPPHLGRARDAAGGDAAMLAAIETGAAALGMNAAPLLRRARHFLEECRLVDRAFDALAAGDVAGFAAAANRSAAAGAELLENQVPETLGLAELARELGAAAASPFGGGFGGSVWALVPEAEAEAFAARWREVYRRRFPARDRAEFFTTPAAPPARPLQRIETESAR